MHLYTLTNRLTGKVYVGATTISMPRRLGCHRQDAEKGRKTLIAQAIREHGWKSFDVAVIGHASSLQELLTAEAETIQRLGSLHPLGYNRSDYGSNGWRFTNEERQRISEATKGRRPWNLGLKTGPLSEKTKAALSLAQRGRIAWNRGVPHTAETRLLMRESAAREKHPCCRAITFDGAQYPSITAACRATGMSQMQMKYRLMKGIARYVNTGG